MKTRPYKPEDEPQLRALHAAQGLPYEFPDLSSAEFVGIMIAEDAEGRIVQAIAARKTVEVFLFVDHSWRTPAWRYQIFGRLHLAIHQIMLSFGYKDAHCWIPPSLQRSFGRRLVKSFGWVQSKWCSWAKIL